MIDSRILAKKLRYRIEGEMNARFNIDDTQEIDKELELLLDRIYVSVSAAPSERNLALKPEILKSDMKEIFSDFRQPDQIGE